MIVSIIEMLLLEVVMLRFCVRGKQIVIQQNHLLQFCSLVRSAREQKSCVLIFSESVLA